MNGVGFIGTAMVVVDVVVGVEVVGFGVVVGVVGGCVHPEEQMMLLDIIYRRNRLSAMSKIVKNLLGVINS